MKLIFLFFSLFVLSCHGTDTKPAQSKSEAGSVLKNPSDSTVTIQFDSFTNVVYLPCPSADSLMMVLSVVERERDSFKTEAFLSQLRVEKVKYYTGIVDRNPPQLKFLRGWIKRAVQ